jgi:hypothetical protein
MRMGKPVFKKHVGTSTLADILLQTIKQKIYKVIRHVIHSEWGGCPRRKLQRGTALGSRGQHRSQVLEVNYSVNLVNHIHRSVSREEGTSCVQLPEQASCTPKNFPRCSDHMSICWHPQYFHDRLHRGVQQECCEKHLFVCRSQNATYCP